MKTLALILGIILLAPVGFIGGVVAKRSFGDAKSMKDAFGSADGMPDAQRAELEQSIKVMYAKQFGMDFPSPARLQGGAVLSVLGVLTSLLLVVFAFVKKDKAVAVAVALVGFFAVAALAYPAIPTGPHDGLAPRPGILIALGFAAVQALLLVFYAKKSQRTAA